MNEEKKRIPKVRLAKPAGRPIQLRYTDPDTGKEIRISTKTHDEAEAIEQKKTLEAKLRLGLDTKPKRRTGGPTMLWSDFRERYRELLLSGLRERSAEVSESRLDMVELLLKPRTLADVASSEVIHELQARLLAGEGSRFGKRAPITARNYVVSLIAALNWAATMGWLPAVPKVRKVKIAKQRQMKGRPLTDSEFARMLDCVRDVVGDEAAPSWEYLLRALVESGLRLDELMHLHWSDGRYIVPDWPVDNLPVLTIPAAMQKNDTEESIPLLPGFESLLLETPELERFGWVVNPMSLATKRGQPVRCQRAGTEWVSRIVGRIGKAAGIVVRTAAGVNGDKYASSHDLRRTCAERLVTAGIPEREVARILRHASVETTRRHYAPGTVQESARIIRQQLSVPGYIDGPELA